MGLPAARSTRIFLACVVVVAACLRIGFAGFGRGYIERTSDTVLRDTVDYRAVAHHVLAGEGLAVDPLHLATRPPLYPIFLAGVFAIAGDGWWPARIAQTLLSVASLVLCFFLGRTWFGEGAAKLGAVLYALNPFLVFYCGFELTETLAAFLCVAAACAYARVDRGGGLPWAFAVGLLCGLAHLCRPTLGIAAALLAFGFLLARGRERSAWAALAVAALGFLIPVAPWALRNLEVLGSPVVGITGGGQILYSANNPRSETSTEVMCILDEPDPAVLRLPELERDRHYFDAAFAYIRAEPLQYLGRVGWRFYRLWQPVPYAAAFSSPAQTLVAALGEGVFLPFFAYGLWLMRSRWREMLWVIALALALSGVHALILSGMRYRLPVMPLALLLAAHGLLSCVERWRKRGA